MNPSFNFVFGKPASDGRGRWVEGCIVGGAQGYEFDAKLWVLYSPALIQCHRVSLEADRCFEAEDFAAYLRPISSGYFQTCTRTLQLCETPRLDPKVSFTIGTATAVWVDPQDQECPLLMKDLGLLEDQLDRLRRRELLSLAISRFSGHSRRVFAADPSRDGESE